MGNRFSRRLARRMLYFRFLLKDRKRHNSLVLEHILGLPFLVLPGVFNPALFWSSELLAEGISSYPIHSDQIVLDLGTGSGVAAVFAAKAGAQVIGIDINPEATRCASINAMLNKVEANTHFLTGDLFGPIPGRRFDLIIFNPPYFQGDPEAGIEEAFFSRNTIVRFLADLPLYLVSTGKALIVLSSDSDLEGYRTSLAENRLMDKALRQKHVFGETITIHEIQPVTERNRAA
ncbi:MAG: methyltransferase [Anaerolineales bacterium]|nr:methyltransferase [Anaerolineales bacterium]